ncbi:hypothetical protein FHETE_5809 [Fusarium heterosporum]|uniref:Uncharacterized protein n=1 Tax=Fusarium heterosporum TaxID=42747 RepID=A0A8H5T9I9_FUSHE|nr:hypothetical protein FHETE_5809 [Fusarium heterosporum]
MSAPVGPPSKLLGLLSDKNQNPILTIVDIILLHLGIADTYALHATCRSLRWLADYLTDSPRLLNINRQLAPFIKDPGKFRHVLGQCDGLLAGDFARNFFEFGCWQDRELVIYVERGPKFKRLTEYLEDGEGYTTNPAGSDKLVRDKDPDFAIAIKVTASSPIVDIINNAGTTADLNLISWNKAYSLLPLSTVVHHKFYPIKLFDNDLGRKLRLYADQGWTTRDMLWPDVTRKLIPGKECRQVGDSRSLIIKLCPTLHGEVTPDYAFEGNVFSMLWRSDAVDSRLEISAEPDTKSVALRYAYSIGVRGSARNSWKKFLDDKLKRWIYVEMAKTESELRPRGFYFLSPGNYNVPLSSNYKPPDTWDYADDQIIPWFHEWERVRDLTRPY